MQLAMVLFTGVMVAQPRVDARLCQAVQPTRYIMNLTVDPAQERFSGTVRIPLDIKDNVADLRLHASGLTVTKATLTVGKAAPVALTPGHEEEILVLMPKGKGPIKKGAATLELQWNGSLDGQKMRGLYRYKMGDTYWVGSQFEATDARRMAPCFDEPGFKVPLEMTLTVPEALTAVTNGAVTSENKDAKARTKTVTYATTPPLPTYLWAVLVGPYAVVTVPDTTTPPHSGVGAAGQGGPGHVCRAHCQGDRETPGCVLWSALRVRQAGPHHHWRVLVGRHGKCRRHHVPRRGAAAG